MRGRAPNPTYRPAGPPVLFPSRLFGLREWTVEFGDDGALRLGGLGTCKEWRRDGETTWAACVPSGLMPVPRHSSPSPAGNCTCGLHAHHPWAVEPDAWDAGEWPRSFPMGVAGIVEAWGRVQVHAEGFRAQYARPRALAVIGCSLDSDFGRVVRGLGDAHKADVLEMRNTGALIEHCVRAGHGLAEARVDSLLDGR